MKLLRVERAISRWLAGSTASHPFGLASGQAVHVAGSWPLRARLGGPLAGWDCGAAEEMARGWAEVRQLGSENVRDPGVYRDARGFDFADDVHKQIAGGVVLIDGEGSGVGSALGTERDVLANVGRADHVAVQIGTEGKMIQLVVGRASLFPNAETEVAGGGRARRVEDFGAVGVPLGEAHVHNSAIGNETSTLGNESDVPEANNRRAYWGGTARLPGGRIGRLCRGVQEQGRRGVGREVSIGRSALGAGVYGRETGYDKHCEYD
jgi:hypothetical protein